MSNVNRQSRWFVICVSSVIVLIFLIVLMAVGPFSTIHWVGRKDLPVHVLVLDADSHQPIIGANVVLFNGPHSPIEVASTLDASSDLSPEHENAEPQIATTDSDGRAVFIRKFFAAGTKGPFEETGYVDTSEVWVKISANNYSAITLPLDGQSARPRDIDNEYPVFITLLLANVKTTNAVNN